MKNMIKSKVRKILGTKILFRTNNEIITNQDALIESILSAIYFTEENMQSEIDCVEEELQELVTSNILTEEECVKLKELY